MALVIIGCKKEPEIQEYDVHQLYGKWELKIQSGGFFGINIDYDTIEDTESLEFTANGISRLYRNEELILQRNYIIVRGKSMYTQDSLYKIQYEQDLALVSFEFGTNDTLFLGEECYDCYTYTYIRKDE